MTWCCFVLFFVWKQLTKPKMLSKADLSVDVMVLCLCLTGAVTHHQLLRVHCGFVDLWRRGPHRDPNSSTGSLSALCECVSDTVLRRGCGCSHYQILSTALVHAPTCRFTHPQRYRSNVFFCGERVFSESTSFPWQQVAETICYFQGCTS